MSSAIAANITLPGYVETMTSDFTTTTPVQRSASQITVMNSMQEFFEYRILILCGIPSIEMLGAREDWVRLETKLNELQAMLAPISGELGLDSWWTKVRNVLQNLVNTYDGEPDKDWWSRIIHIQYKGGCVFGYAWTGWFTRTFVVGSELSGRDEFKSGLVSVPMTIDYFGHVEDAALVAGIAGYTVTPGDGPRAAPSVQTSRAWALMLEPDSSLRGCIQSL